MAALDWAPIARAVQGSGIVGFIGSNGSGKSLCMVNSVLPSLDAGRIVLSTVRLTDWRDPRPCEDEECFSAAHGEPGHLAAHPFYRPLRTWGDVIAAEGCDVLMDEITGLASARESMSLPAPVANLLVQLRRRDVMMRWSAPAWARADAIIRETTQLAVVCSSHMKRKAPGANWPQATLFRARVLDARDLDELTLDKSAKVRSMRTGFARIARIEGRNAYDTFDNVASLPNIQGGRCAVCSGRRSVPQCSCDKEHGLTQVAC